MLLLWYFISSFVTNKSYSRVSDQLYFMSLFFVTGSKRDRSVHNPNSVSRQNPRCLAKLSSTSILTTLTSLSPLRKYHSVFHIRVVKEEKLTIWSYQLMVLAFHYIIFKHLVCTTFVHMWCLHVFVQQENSASLGTRVLAIYGPPCRCWELDLGQLQEHLAQSHLAI